MAFIKKQKKSPDINSPDIIGNAPLHRAVSENLLEQVIILLNNGADVNLKNSYGDNPLHIAISRNYLEIAKELLVKGADVNLLNGDGKSLLHNAILGDDLETAKLLVENGADINLVKDGWNPLERATLEKNEEITKLLLGKKASIDLPKLLYTISLQDGDFNWRKTVVKFIFDIHEYKEEKITSLYNLLFEKLGETKKWEEISSLFPVDKFSIAKLQAITEDEVTVEQPVALYLEEDIKLNNGLNMMNQYSISIRQGIEAIYSFEYFFKEILETRFPEHNKPLLLASHSFAAIAGSIIYYEPDSCKFYYKFDKILVRNAILGEATYGSRLIGHHFIQENKDSLPQDGWSDLIYFSMSVAVQVIPDIIVQFISPGYQISCLNLPSRVSLAVLIAASEVFPDTEHNSKSTVQYWTPKIAASIGFSSGIFMRERNIVNLVTMANIFHKSTNIVQNILRETSYSFDHISAALGFTGLMTSSEIADHTSEYVITEISCSYNEVEQLKQLGCCVGVLEESLLIF